MTTPDLPASLTLLPMVMLSLTPQVPPIMTLLPILVLPAMPAPEAMRQPWPISTLWAIWQRLSILV